MKNKLAIVSILFILMACSCSIQKYSLVEIKPDTIGLYVNRLPSNLVTDYDPDLSDSWIRTYNKCIQIKAAIDKEIDIRDRRQNSIVQIFSGIGGTTGLATAVYVLAVANPSTTVIGIMGIFSGTTFATSMGFAKDDQIAVSLKEKSKNLELFKSQAETELTTLEELIAKKNLLVRIGKADLKSIDTNGRVIQSDPEPNEDVVKMYESIEKQIITLRTVLSKWDNEAK
jgi:hypothetical protein